MRKEDPADAAARAERRRVRLVRELSDEGVELIDPVALCDDLDEGLSETEASELEEVLIDELAYARNPPVHEQRRPSYGCIVYPGTDLPYDVPDEMELSELVDEDDFERARELADGIHTFVARASQGGAALAHLSATDEYSLVHLAGETGAWIIQRHPNGTVRVFGRERLHLFLNDEWTVKPYGHTRWVQLTHVVGAEAGQATVGMALLDLCLHVLSARRIGATFVWMVRGGVESLTDHLQRPSRPIATALNVTERRDFEPLATLLASVDGACLIDEDGSVVGVESFLRMSEDAKKHVDSRGGTRHTSAACFSFDVAEAVVFVVSADGPVTIFSDGVDALRLDEDVPYAAALRAPPSFSRIAKVENVRTECASCRKPLIVELQLVDGANHMLTQRCPVCGSPAHEAEAFSTSCRVAKPWEPPNASVTWGFGAALVVAENVNPRERGPS